MFDSQTRLVICNQRFLAMYGLEADGIRPGHTLRHLLERRIANGTISCDAEHYADNVWAMVKAGKPTTRFIELNDGRTIAIDNQPMPGGGWVSTHEDVTERRQAEMKIAHMARHDALTGLPNRVLLRERLNEALAHVHRGQRLAVHYLDLDLFKNVNDSLGHPAGDELLRMVAERLRCCVRDTDTVCRVGGDEFFHHPGGHRRHHRRRAPGAAHRRGRQDALRSSQPAGRHRCEHRCCDRSGGRHRCRPAPQEC
jgi:hypothetical protein